MKELALRLLVALLVIGLMGAIAWAAINAGDSPTRATSADAGVASEPPPDASRPRLSGTAAAAALQQIGEVSQRLLPDGYQRIFLGMSLSDLRQERPRIQRDAAPRPDGQQLFAEDDPSGARVVYLVSEHGLLTQVQFMSRLDGTEGLSPHFQALQQRYGRPTGVWDCPETAEAPPLRRFTWRREGASAMEAVLIYGQTVSITLVIAATEDVGTALTRSRCEPVRDAQQLERFPVARELRGERSEFIREVHRDL